MKPRTRSTPACHACRLRKVKCDGDGDLACSKCTRLSLKCSYPETNSEAKLRRATVRGSVIQAWQGERGIRDGSASASEAGSASGSGSRFGSEAMDGRAVLRFPGGVSLGETSKNHDHVSVVEEDFFLGLATDYATYLLPTFPVVSEAEYVAAVSRVNQSQDDYALVHIIAAATWTIVGEHATSTALYLDQINSLYTKAIHVRRHVTAWSDITTNSVLISVFMAKCVADGNGDSVAGKYYLRDAISRLQLLRVGDPRAQAQQTPMERSRRERLYWIMFVQERYDALTSFRPAILDPLPDLPERDMAMPAMIHTGFIHLIQLFRMVDDDFIRYRLGGSDASITLQWIREKHAELGTDDRTAEEEFRSLSLLQQVDLSVTRNWLRALVWQMSLHILSDLPEGASEEDHMSILFPIRLSHNLRSLLLDMPVEAVEIHSIGILYKIFEIAAISADVLEHIFLQIHDAAQQSEYIDNFVFLSRFLLAMPRFDARVHLEQKVDRVHSLFPWYFERIHELGTMW